LMLAAVTATILLAVALLTPIKRPAVETVPAETRRVVLEQADLLDETMLEDLRELADKDRESVAEVVTELEKLVEEMRDPKVDQREALAKLSMMQQSIADAMNQFNLQQTDVAFESLASSIDSAAALQQAAADLKAEQYDEAAEKLEQFDPQSTSNKERRAVANSLKKLSKNLAKGNLGELSESTAEMAEGLEKKNDSQCKSGACKLARLARKQSLRKSICKCLGNQLNQLAMCKTQCNSNGCQSDSKSETPSNTWGRGSRDPLGDTATEIHSRRERVDLQGEQGEGPSEKEVISSVEAKQMAARSYQERYREFRKQAEAVLENEPLPLGHRQTVRDYFESIRPDQPETN